MVKETQMGIAYGLHTSSYGAYMNQRMYWFWNNYVAPQLYPDLFCTKGQVSKQREYLNSTLEFAFSILYITALFEEDDDIELAPAPERAVVARTRRATPLPTFYTSSASTFLLTRPGWSSTKTILSTTAIFVAPSSFSATNGEATITGFSRRRDTFWAYGDCLRCFPMLALCGRTAIRRKQFRPSAASYIFIARCMQTRSLIR